MYRRGYLYTTVCQDKELSDVHNENRIVKMHGDFAHNNFVLKEEDYFHYHSNFRKIAAYVKSVLANNIVLFAGCSLQDPEIRQIFSWIKEIAETFIAPPSGVPTPPIPAPHPIASRIGIACGHFDISS